MSLDPDNGTALGVLYALGRIALVTGGLTTVAWLLSRLW